MDQRMKRELLEAVQAHRDWATHLLAGWVRCPSILGHEASAQMYIKECLDDMGLDVREEAVDNRKISSLPGYSPSLISYENRPNIVGAFTPARESTGRSLIVNGHVDVVSPEPVSLWSNPPFDPTIFTDDLGETWMQGRGAGDMKGGTVACLWGLKALLSLGLSPTGAITIQSCIEEECTGNGTLSLLSSGATATGCIIPEPFDQTILVEQAGVLWFDVRVIGKTTHVLGTKQGINAIEKAWQIYRYLKVDLESPANRPEVLPKGYAEIVHPANLNLGVIEGGDWPSTVAGECTMRLRMGILPGTDCDSVMKKVEAVVQNTCAEDPWLADNPPEIAFRGFQAEPSSFDVDSELYRVLKQSHETVHGRAPSHLHATCTTDVRFFNNYYEIPATCYGPKAIAIHGVDERVSIDSMEQVALVMAHLIANWCGVEEDE